MSRTQSALLLVFAMVCTASLLKAQAPGGLIKRTPENVEAARRAERNVTLDVQITDRSGKPLNDLTQQDITLFDDNRPQTITSFQRLISSAQVPPVEVVLLLDTMNASPEDVVIERQGIEKFLTLNGGHLAFPVSIVFLADTGVRISKPSRDGTSLAEDLKKLPTPVRVIGTAQGAEGAEDRAQRSLHALQMLCAYETPRAGRKLLIWVGPGWPLLSRSTADLSTRERARYFNNIVDMTTNLRKARITLYSVQPLNLAQVNGQSPLFYQAYLKGVENPVQADSPNLALQVLAVHSGGRVLGQSGDLAGQIALCFEDGEAYYEITFDAAESDSAIQYHALWVKIDQPGATARTNTSYYAGVPQSAQPIKAPEATTPAPDPSAPTQILKAEARLVIVDVTVLDKHGQPVTGLAATDFALREDNAPQKIVSLEEHTPSNAPIPTLPAAASSDGTIVADNKPASASVWNVLLVDIYNTPNEDRGRLQNQLEQFVKQLPEHEPIALVTMSTHIKVDVSFQDGAGAVYRYLRKYGLGPLDSSTPANIVERQDPTLPSADIFGSSVFNQANVDVDRQANRAQTTLNNFSALAQWLEPYPGRKNVYWLSGGFPLQGQPFGVTGYSLNQPDLGPDTKGGHPIPMQQQTDKALQSARIAIYPVDVRGVAATDVDGVTTADTEFKANIAIALAKDNDLAGARRQEMLEIAKATGGVAQFNNDIPRVLRDEFARAGAFYAIAYTPPDKEWKGAYHRIQLAIDRPDVQPNYREGYYAKDADRESQPSRDLFLAALRLGAPAEMAVQFTTKINRSADGFTIDSSVDPRTVDFQQNAPTSILLDIDFAILEYDAKGKILEKAMSRLSGKMTPEQMKHLSAKTLSTTQTIKLDGGATTLVVGVRDNISGRFGRVEASIPRH